MNEKQYKKVKTVLDRTIIGLGFVMLVQLFVMLIAMQSVNRQAIQNQKSNDKIEKLVADYGETLAIPQIIYDSKTLNIDNYRNIMCDMQADEAELAFAQFQDVRACPLGVYLSDDETVADEYYTVTNKAVDYIRFRQTEDNQYLTYKYGNLAYTLKLDKSCQLQDALQYLGLNITNLEAQNADDLNNQFGVDNSSKSTNETAMTGENTFGNYVMNFDNQAFGMVYGVNTDGQVNFYLDNKLVMTITDQPDFEVADDAQEYDSETDSNIKIWIYGQDFQSNRDSESKYQALIMSIDGLQKTLKYAQEQ